MDHFKKDIEQSLKTLRAGGIILYPTDTVWGVGCDAMDEDAIDKIFDIKKRSKSKSMIILVSSAAMIKEYVAAPSNALIDVMANATSPTTGIFSKAKNLPPNLVGGDGSIAIRIASDDFCKELITKFGKPVVSTSANISQQPSPQNFSQIDPILVKEVDYTVFFRRDDDTKKKPSHIIKIDGKGKIERIR